jgi:hypothetical protein
VLPEPSEDAYTIEGYPRKLVKKAFNILINRKKPAPATGSLIFYLNKNKKEYVDDKHPQPPTIDKPYCEALEKAIRDHHKPIEQFFCSGIGLELQNQDSLLCGSIFDYFLVKTDSIVLAVHDSFIVKQSDVHHLAEALRLAESVVAKALNKTYRERELEAEVAKPLPNYDELLFAAFGQTIATKTTAEEAILQEYLNQELELLDDIQSLADADAGSEVDPELR